jgi:hypothetical protein
MYAVLNRFTIQAYARVRQAALRGPMLSGSHNLNWPQLWFCNKCGTMVTPY